MNPGSILVVGSSVILSIVLWSVMHSKHEVKRSDEAFSKKITELRTQQFKIAAANALFILSALS